MTEKLMLIRAKDDLAMRINLNKFMHRASPVIDKTKPTPEGVIYDCLWGTTFDTDYEMKITSSIMDKE